MVQLEQFSNKPGRYDQQRVARLQPIEAAIERLRLPSARSRKLHAIITALEVQIEDGGDSPEANRLLLEALRAGVRHQVADGQARAVLRAIDEFEKVEAKRWEQVRAGSLPPLVSSQDEELDELIRQGYELLDDGHILQACDRWLEAWDQVMRLARPEQRTSADFDDAHPDLSQFLVEWCLDLDTALSTAAAERPVYHERRLRFAREFLERFPDEDEPVRVNVLLAQAEALWGLDRRQEAVAAYAGIVEQFPDEAWAYVDWADRYWLDQRAPRQFERAEALLRRALDRPLLNDRLVVLDRLQQLYQEWGRPAEQAAVAAERERLEAERAVRMSGTPASPPVLAAATPTAPPAGRKLSRNSPCWCGSGKKYKRCHLQADDVAGR